MEWSGDNEQIEVDVGNIPSHHNINYLPPLMSKHNVIHVHPFTTILYIIYTQRCIYNNNAPMTSKQYPVSPLIELKVGEGFGYVDGCPMRSADAYLPFRYGGSRQQRAYSSYII